MPLYDYKCEACGETFEAFSSVNAEPKICNLCHKGIAKRIPSIGGVTAFGTQTFEDLHEGNQLTEITSKEQLARECHKAGVYATQLRGSDKYERIMRGEY